MKKKNKYTFTYRGQSGEPPEWLIKKCTYFMRELAKCVDVSKLDDIREA
jgi:hypothetical protein